MSRLQNIKIHIAVPWYEVEVWFSFKMRDWDTMKYINWYKPLKFTGSFCGIVDFMAGPQHGYKAHYDETYRCITRGMYLGIEITAFITPAPAGREE